MPPFRKYKLNDETLSRRLSYHFWPKILPRETSFFVGSALLAPLTELLEFQLPFHLLLVLGCVVVRPLTDGTF